MKNPLLNRLYRHIINPPSNTDISAAINQHDQFLPTLWLLGKTGAGKSSIVQKLTGQSTVEVGNGFAPCTQTARYYQFPADAPIMRFLDTRGLAEADYDPAADLTEASRASHALLIVMRADDTDQRQITQALSTITTLSPSTPIVNVHTALHDVPDQRNRERAITTNQQSVERVLKRELPSVRIDFTQPEDGIDPHDYGLESLKDAIVDLMPELHLLHNRHTASDTENRIFETLKYELYWYAGVAAASDAIPAVGLVTVPGIQGKMLHSLAQHYGVTWTKRNAAELLGAMGLSFFYRYGISLGGRQLSKLIPVYGQSAGAVAAASISFVTTVALGRAACKYLYAKSAGEPINTNDIRNAYEQSMKEQARRSNDE